jgi:hypothetical protein
MTSVRRLPLLITLLLLLASATALASAGIQWRTVHRSALTVSEGAVTAAGGPQVETDSAAMRAVVRDRGHHATGARLTFQFLGPSAETEALGSGEIRQQIGLKLRASDPCNLVYVMWRNSPDEVIEVLVKRNAGETTSSECENNGYTEAALIPETADPSAQHVLDVRTSRKRDGSLALVIRADGRVVRRLDLSAALTAGLNGPVGVRSDNGQYTFKLQTPR